MFPWMITESQRIYKVSEITLQIKEVLESSFPYLQYRPLLFYSER